MRFISYSLLTLFAVAPSAWATVTVSSPSNGQTVGTTASYIATSTTTCSRGVASMGVYVDNQLVKVVDANTLSTSISLTAGNHQTVVQEWDYCGGSTYTPIAVTVAATAAGQSGVSVTSPAANSTVGLLPTYVASATSTCSRGVASMGVYVDNLLVKVVNGSELNTAIPLTLGNHETVVQEWDYCGGSTYTAVPVVVATASKVSVTSPAPNSTVGLLVDFMATATSTCSTGVASMGVYANNQLLYKAQGATLNKSLELSAGAQHTVIEEWDNCGGTASSTIDFTVSDAGTKLSNLQAGNGCQSWGQLPPVYVDCSPCTGLNWSMAQKIKSPSLSGAAAQFNTTGSTPYGVVLWYNPVIGQYSTQGLPDEGKTLVPSLHNFTYDTDLYIDNLAVTQVLEFDVAMYMNGTGMFFGTQCEHLGSGGWDVLNNVTQQWNSAGVPCKLANGWNHLTLQFQRGTGNQLIYQSITLNGVTYNINKTYAPFTVPASWYGITVNYQMDGNSKQSANTTYLDNLSLTYW